MLRSLVGSEMCIRDRLLPDVVNKYYSELSDIFIFTADYKKQLQLEDKYAQIENAIDAVSYTHLTLPTIYSV